MSLQASGNLESDRGTGRTSPPVKEAPRPAEPRVLERRRRPDPTALGMPLGAAFLGFLMAQSQQGVAAALPSGGGQEGASTQARFGERPFAAGRTDGAIGDGMSSAARAHLGSGSAVDTGYGGPLALSSAIAGQQGTMELVGGHADDLLTSLDGLPRTGSGPTQINVSMPGSTQQDIPGGPVDDADRGGEGLGPIGEHVQGGSGNDVIIGTDKDDVLKGGAGNDTIDGRAGNDDLDGEEGDDVVLGGTGNDLVQGGSGNDLVDGQAGDDAVDGGSGEDTALGGTGNDLVSGGSGDDVVDGGPGTDTAIGDGGNDRLFIDSVRDLAMENREGFDQGGIDTVAIRDGYAVSLKMELPDLSPQGLATFVLGDQVGIDLPPGFNPFVQQIHPAIENIDLLGSTAHDVVGGEGSNRIQGNDADNLLWGRGGEDWIHGGGGRDVVWGGEGADRLMGGEGADRLGGDAGDDVIYGGAGDDVLAGGSGADILYGSAGRDSYMLGQSEARADRVFDGEGLNTLHLDDAFADDVQAIVSGPDLYIRVSGNDVAVIDHYIGHEDNWTGLVTKNGLQDLGDFLVGGSVVVDPSLPVPPSSVVGGEGDDILRAPTGSGHELRGMGGNDQLFGGAGSDRLDGGMGSDSLKGGTGADSYVLRKGDSGVDRIADHDGPSTIEVKGIDFKDLSGWKVGHDLWLSVDTTPLGMVEDWDSNSHAWSIKVGDKVMAADDMFS